MISLCTTSLLLLYSLQLYKLKEKYLKYSKDYNRTPDYQNIQKIKFKSKSQLYLFVQCNPKLSQKIVFVYVTLMTKLDIVKHGKKVLVKGDSRNKEHKI